MDPVRAAARPAAARPLRPAVAAGALLTVLAVALVLALTSGGTGGFDRPGLLPAHGAGGGIHAGDPDLVVLDGVSGRVRVSADSGAHGVSGTFVDADGHGLRVRTQSGSTAGRDTLTVRCADAAGAAAPCAGDLALTLPAHTGLRLRQTSGETDLTGIGGPLDVTTASDRLTAVALHCAGARFRVTSGSADVGFSGAPGALSVQATSASMTLRLPADGAGYAVSSAATSANVSVQVPQDGAAAHHVSLQVASGSLALLPA
jgi:hypothetical protein